MGRPGKDDDHIDLAGIVQCAVSSYDLDLWPGGKVRLCARSEYTIVFDSRYPSGRTDELGKNGAVIASASAHLQHARARRQVKGIEESSPEAGLSIVEIPGLVD
jgi:hypothetical protein